MNKSNVCPTEDAIQVFMDYLVEPLLPCKDSRDYTPMLDKQKAVAKQVHAVVLLYNYYHRKIHPQLEDLGFEQFCKLALVLKPLLKSHMKFMLRPDDAEPSDVEMLLSLTEKVIKDACDISASLVAPSDVPSTKGWPVSKVAVLLIDLSKEKCFLRKGIITRGVWSVIEKDVNDPCWNSDDSFEAKHMNKRKKIHSKHLQDESGADEGCFQQFAFLAVKEAIHEGFSQADVNIIESHVVRSLTKEMTTTRFYIMQFVAEKDIAHWIPIRDVLDSLQGPLVKKSSSLWIHTSVVEYFHLLPYAQIISQCFSRGQGSVPEVVNVNGSEVKEPCKPIHNNRNDVVRAFGSTVCTEPESEKQKLENVHCSNVVLEAIDGPQNKVVDKHSVVYSRKKLVRKNVAQKGQDDALPKMTSSRAESELNGTSNVAKLQCEVDRSGSENRFHLKGPDIANKKADLHNGPPCQDGLPADNHALNIHESNSKCHTRLQNTVASKEHILSNTALSFLLSKRDKLVLQQRSVGDEIAWCDKKIQTILNGGEDVLDLKIDLIVEGCNHKSASDRTIRDYEGQCSNPCQELDSICNEKNWILPTYHVFPLDGGYAAKLSVRGLDFEASTVGDTCPKPLEARGSAAAKMLFKLRSLSTAAAGALFGFKK